MFTDLHWPYYHGDNLVFIMIFFNMTQILISNPAPFISESHRHTLILLVCLTNLESSSIRVVSYISILLMKYSSVHILLCLYRKIVKWYFLLSSSCVVLQNRLKDKVTIKGIRFILHPSFCRHLASANDIYKEVIV